MLILSIFTCLFPLLTFFLFKLTHQIYISTLFSFLVLFILNRFTLQLKPKKEIFIFFCIHLILSTLLIYGWAELYPTGEKMRDFSLLVASKYEFTKNGEPWLPGKNLSYYNYWYDFGGIFSTITTISLKHTYFILIAYFFTLFSTLFYEVLRTKFNFGKVLSILGILIVAWGSNVAGTKYFFNLDSHWWNASRSIQGAITEFPFWSFMFSDYHPHFLNMFIFPFAYLASENIVSSVNSKKIHMLLISSFFFLLYKFIMLTNPWDVFALFSLYVFFMLKILFMKNDHAFILNKKMIMTVLVTFSTFLILLQLRTPHYHSVIRFRWVNEMIGRTSFLELFNHWGYWLLLICSGFVIAFKNLTRIHFLFLATTLVLILLPEIFFLDDAMTAPYERMNFIFKVYVGAWSLIALVSFSWIQLVSSKKLQYVFIGTIALVSLLFSFKTIPARFSEKGSSGTIISRIENKWPNSSLAIKEFTLLPFGVTVQSSKSAYDKTSLISVLSEKNTYLGWGNHLLVLGYDYEEVQKRTKMIDQIYTEIQCTKKLEAFHMTKARYLVVSPQEKLDYPLLVFTDFSCFKKLINTSSVTVFTF